MKQKFNKTRLATSLSLILSVSTVAPTYAENAENAENELNKEMEVISVTGIRGSLIKSMDIKKSSSGIIDAISAEDIGKMPDTNLAESLQRVPGVSIDRQNGEGSRVSVRGFGADQNLVLLNGRQMPVTTGSRSFDFSNIASEGIIGVEIRKTSQASSPTGGIGATIDVLTHRPLYDPGLKASIGAKAVHDTSTDKGNITPELSALYSNTFADDKFGIALTASYQKRDSGNQQANVGTGWRSFPGEVDNDWGAGTAEWGGVPQDNQINRPGEGDVYSVPQTTIYKFEEQQRTRTNGQLVLQYSPVDSLVATLDYTYMRNDIDTQYNDVSAWFTFAPSENTWTDGPVSSPLVYSESYDTNQDLSMAAGDYGVRNESGSLGLNLDWEVSDSLNITLDMHKSNAEMKPNSIYGSNNSLSTAAFIRTTAATDFSKDLPALAVGGGNAVKPSDMRVTGSVFGNARNKSEIEQYQLDGEYVFEEAGSIDFGIALTDVNNHSQSINVQRNDWGGVGQAGDFEDAWFPSDTIHDKFDADKGNFADADGDFDLLDTIFFWDFDAVRNKAEELYTPAGYVGAGDCGTDFCPSSKYAMDVDRFTQEKSKSAYIQYNFDSEFGQMPWDIHVGIRYEKTNVNSTSAVGSYDGAEWIADTEIELQSTGMQDFQTKKGDYDYFLPNVNFNIEVHDDVIIRAAYSQTIGRPDYTSIQGGTVVGALANQSGGSGSSGNPSLLPLESTNYDFSAEWYYSDTGYASVGYFRKDVTNFIDSRQINSNIYNIADPANGPKVDAAKQAGASTGQEIRDYIFANYPNDPSVDVANGIIYGDPATDPDLNFLITEPDNLNDSSVIDGWEFAIQHFFGDSGFGAIANYTLVNAGDDFDNQNLGREDDLAQNVLTNISDTANLIAIYDNYGFQARLAYNWRDEFLNSTNQGTGANPQYTEAYSQVDFNVSYEVAALEGLTVFFEGLNITNEYTRVHGRAKEQVLNLTQTGARYSLGARYTF